MKADDLRCHLDPSVGYCGVLDVSGPAARAALHELLKSMLEPTYSQIIATIIVVPKGWRREDRLAIKCLHEYTRTPSEALRRNRAYYSKNAQKINAERRAKRRAGR